MEYQVDFYDRARLDAYPESQFKKDLKKVFDASIPWDNPTYDAGFQDHYFEHAEAAVVIRHEGQPVALSLAFSGECEERSVLYISGIWVDTDYKSQGLGKLIIDALVECGVKSCFGDYPSNVYLSLRTQNPQVYEYFLNQYDLYPKPDRKAPEDIARVAHWVHDQYSAGKVYEKDNLIIRRIFPKGIIVGDLHPARTPVINEFVESQLNIRDGDSFILVMKYC